jgi:hypothetical protein
MALGGVAVSVGILELVARGIQLNRLPVLPYFYEGGATVLPGDADLDVWFRGYPPTRYVTDGRGARVADRARGAVRPRRELLVLGDSQALGYMLDFQETFASRVAARLTGDSGAARILAAPASTPASLVPALRRYAAGGLERQRLAVVTLNLGNDLDEMYLEARGQLREPAGATRRWLMLHSFLYMDGVLASARLASRNETAAGVNPILYLLQPAERVALARATADGLARLVAEVPADRKLVVVVPQDVQVDPNELQKYQRYYRDAAEWSRWSARRHDVARMMNALEDFICRELAARGQRVIRLSKLAAARRTGAPLFADTSHHMTAAAHELIADAIVAALAAEGEPLAAPASAAVVTATPGGGS